MKTFKEKIEDRDSDILIYSFAPPKHTTVEERLATISKKQLNRINSFDIDAVILYDIQDESHRTTEERTYSFVSTLAPEKYYKEYLQDLKHPAIVYKSIANQTKESFEQWLNENNNLENLVFVGASSDSQTETTNFKLGDAYKIREEKYNHILLGGVTIPERHAKKGDEHLRLMKKRNKGCSFFVSQCVYNVFETKNLLSDYYYDSFEKEQELKPIIFTLSPCGSLKTLEFMKWLGIEVPRWLYNDLRHANDILESSIATSIRIANDIMEFSEKKNIPFGFNIESISNKKEEIEAATEILNKVSKLMGRTK